MTNSRSWTAPVAGQSFVSGSSPPPAVSSWRRGRMHVMRLAADYESAGARRGVHIALGVIWLLDGVLQYQPVMFTRGFVTQIIDPAGAGSPSFVAGPLTLAGRVILHSPVLFNALFATTQVAIGIGLLWRGTVRAALAGSIAWGLSVWWLGEGLGGIFTGSATPVTGAPGAAVLYVLISALAWPSGSSRHGGSVASGGPLGERWARPTWVALWGSGAYFLLLASNQAAGALRGQVTSAAAGEPGWIASVDHGAASVIGTQATAVSLVLAAVFVIIALGVFVPAATRPVLVLAVITAVAIWVVGEGLGGMLTGRGTDPNTGPLLILLAIAYWPQTQPIGRSSPPPAAAKQGRHRAGTANTGHLTRQLRQEISPVARAVTLALGRVAQRG
jgi:hypothetical protein